MDLKSLCDGSVHKIPLFTLGRNIFTDLENTTKRFRVKTGRVNRARWMGKRWERP